MPGVHIRAAHPDDVCGQPGRAAAPTLRCQARSARAQVGMEMYARWAHRVLWHDFQPGWAIHESHHRARTGPFEANDIFAIMNAAPAIALTAYGFFTPTEVGGICFGLGMGITVFGIMYMFIHDGLIHKRFPVGPIAEVPVLKRIAIAHRLHHSDKYNGVPFGMCAPLPYPLLCLAPQPTSRVSKASLSGSRRGDEVHVVRPCRELCPRRCELRSSDLLSARVNAR